MVNQPNCSTQAAFNFHAWHRWRWHIFSRLNWIWRSLSVCVKKGFSPILFVRVLFFSKVLAIIRQQAQSPNKFLCQSNSQTQMTAVQNGDAKRSALVSSAQEWNNCWSLHSVAHLDLHKRNDTPGASSNDHKIVQLTSIIQKCGTVLCK